MSSGNVRVKGGVTRTNDNLHLDGEWCGSYRAMESAEDTEDNEDTDVKSGFGRVLGMASVFGVSSAGQRLDCPTPIYSRF